MNSNNKKLLLRLIFFCFFVFITISGVIPDFSPSLDIGIFNFRTNFILPVFSPLLLIFTLIISRNIWMPVLFSVPGLILSIFKERWFCKYMCPVGLAAEYTGRLKLFPKIKLNRIPEFNRIILLITIGGFFFGYPHFLWLDPLVIFNTFLVNIYYPKNILNIIYISGLSLMILLSLFIPGIWCYRICPLGTLLDYIFKLFSKTKGTGSLLFTFLKKVKSKDPVPLVKKTKRNFIYLVSGAVIALIVKNIRSENIPLRPPGSIGEDKFNALCTRCGNCIRVCPAKIIKPSVNLNIISIHTPILEFGPGYCSELCNECNRVCPTGAIRHISLKKKNNIIIGTASINQLTCLSWINKKDCVLCEKVCPYNAIQIKAINNLKVPVIIHDECRGCGLCQVICPVEPKSIGIGVVS